MRRNAKSDKAQYEKYISVLGKENMPKKFDLFQDLKYNNSESWVELKSDYRYKKMLDNRDVVLANDFVRSLPVEGKPNSITDFVDSKGVVKQRRLYGPNGKAYKDIDTTDHG